MNVIYKKALASNQVEILAEVTKAKYIPKPNEIISIMDIDYGVTKVHLNVQLKKQNPGTKTDTEVLHVILSEIGKAGKILNVGYL